MINIVISNQIREKCPDFKLAVIECKVRNTPTSNELWDEIEREGTKIISEYKLEDINKRNAISATRKVYKLLGKDPNRYRPSAEALCRRIVRGLPLYKVSTLVDIINLVSIRSGFSIGGFDMDKIRGNLVLGVGTADDDFEGIGRGLLNIEGLPVYRDSIGGIGTPTSDNERTKISDSTTNLLVLINGYSGETGLQEAVDFSKILLERYAFLKKFTIEII
ncbi:hypothetical protein D0T49_04800 [Paludibacter sp. 221]|uniref:B3/B4 domain-containing protein n=1 Tax=Paludibacter sp. 221 TaxID=2302939 RepID=UPI0013D5C384|nr:phenylalanine--tRNA ligase beta subunit-related protein [Paludibacter sp. 221]NDV46357.1 hypothetical protein [Paludibacter sp. 221]